MIDVDILARYIVSKTNGISAYGLNRYLWTIQCTYIKSFGKLLFDREFIHTIDDTPGIYDLYYKIPWKNGFILNTMDMLYEDSPFPQYYLRTALEEDEIAFIDRGIEYLSEHPFGTVPYLAQSCPFVKVRLCKRLSNEDLMDWIFNL